MKKLKLFIFLLPVLMFSCAHKQPPNYIEATKIPDPLKPPVVIEVSKPMPLPGQLRLIPSEVENKDPDEDLRPWEVIAKANKDASHNPSTSGYFNGIMQYDFDPGAIYKVYCAPLKLTDIQLQPDEKIIGKPAAGDTVRWIMGMGESMIDGKLVQQHLYIKPTRAGLDTTLCINTNRRSYHIELHSYKETYMAAVNWRYPHDEIAMIRDVARINDAKDSIITSPLVDIEKLNFKYRIESIKSGTEPKWAPLKAFDDGKKTYIQFPKEMLRYEAPVLFVLSESDDSTQLVNYRVRNEFYIVDRLFQKAELRIGQKDQIIYQIIKEDKS